MNIYGLDISSKIVGIAILNEGYTLTHSEALELPGGSLEARAAYFGEHMRQLFAEYPPDKIMAEEALRGAVPKNGHSVTVLMRINAMCCYEIFVQTGLIVQLINVRSARAALGIKPDPILWAQTGKSTHKRRQLTKQTVVDYVSKRFADNFVYATKRTGRYVDGTDDRADAIVIVLYALKFRQKCLEGR